MASTQPGSVLVLWDIDHTLIETRGVGGAAFRDAFQRVTGCPVREMPHIPGRTEPDIVAATAALHGLAPPPFEDFAEALLEAYAIRQTDLEARGRILPGAEAAVARLATIPTVYQSVLTGNTRAVAQLKLETFGLDSSLDLTIGAYGDDDRYRPALVGIAQKRAAARHKQAFECRTTILIGDSPGDIETGRVGGARVIAVAAGGTPVSELAGADVVVADLTEIDALLQAIDIA